MKNFEQKLDQINQRLKSGNIRLRIVSQGNSLYLRGIFPPRNNEGNGYQQRLALKVGATPEGLKYAEAKAKEYSALLDLKQFDWAKVRSQKTEKFNLHDSLLQMEKDYFATRVKTPASLNTWEREYLKPLGKLPQKPITVELLKDHILTTEPDSRTRRRYALACAKLADSLGFEHNLRELVGNYGIKSLSPRSLPSDELISSVYAYFEKDTAWRWVYGIMACYGVRNHEVFAIDLLDYPIAFVNRGKSGERYCWALFPEWAEMWQLQKIVLPDVSGRTNSELGNRVTKAFERKNIPFSPYNLRHAWAVRSLEFGLDISLASAQMGHSVNVHSKIYHHWITKDVHQRAMNLILSNPHRPQPP